MKAVTCAQAKATPTPASSKTKVATPAKVAVAIPLATTPSSSVSSSTNRRGALASSLGLAFAVGAASLLPAGPAAAKGKFTTIKDTQDGYEFAYPFGWQEVTVDGQDVVYKDIIEPLESVSVSVTSTDKATIDDFGPPAEVAQTLATNVLTPASQEVKVLSVSRSVVDGRAYVDFEFAAKAPSYLRHALARVTVANGKFYTLTTGANELRRWSKVKNILAKVVQSFKVSDRFEAK